jgi:ribosomal-protein-alanine N-acetyltransferase
MRTALRYCVRPMRIEDVPQVLEVERQSFPSMWPPTAFKRELQQNRLAHYIVVTELNPAAPPAEPKPELRPSSAFGRLFGELRHRLATEEAGPLPPPDQRPELIAGFVGLWMLPDEAHIVTIAVRESHRRRGLGELLLITAIHLAQAKGQAMMTLECRVSNEAALALYRKYGFQQVGRRPQYYSDNREDALILTIDSVLSDSYRARFEALKAEHRRRWSEYYSPNER